MGSDGVRPTLLEAVNFIAPKGVVVVAPLVQRVEALSIEATPQTIFPLPLRRGMPR